MLLKVLSLDEIRVDPGKNPRARADDAAIEELMDSITSVRELSGTQKVLLQPLVVVPLSESGGKEKYELRLGYRRYEALRRLADKNRDNVWATRPEVLIDDHDPDDEEDHATQAFALIENIQREPMSPIDEARAIQRLIADHGLRQKDVCVLLGKSKGWVSQRLKLLKTDPAVQEALGAGDVGQAVGRQLSRLTSKKDQKSLLELGQLSGWQESDWIAAVDEVLAGTFKPKEELKRKKAEAREKKVEGEEETPSREEEKKEGEPTIATFTNATWHYRREPQEVKRVTEDLEFDGDEKSDPYVRGALDTIRWLVGLREKPPGANGD